MWPLVPVLLALQQPGQAGTTLNGIVNSPTQDIISCRRDSGFVTRKVRTLTKTASLGGETDGSQSQQGGSELFFGDKP